MYRLPATLRDARGVGRGQLQTILRSELKTDSLTWRGGLSSLAVTLEADPVDSQIHLPRDLGYQGFESTLIRSFVELSAAPPSSQEGGSNAYIATDLQ
jgi:hypothetical protein